MSTRGSKVERNSASDQPHEIKYEAPKYGIGGVKKAAGNQRSAIERKVK